MAGTARPRESSSDYWASIGALTDQTRYILAKRPGIPERRNLEQQRRSLEDGVPFCWLLYENPDALRLWSNYLNELRALGISDERIQRQVRCRVIPKTLAARSIDWRIAIFGDQLALCSYEPDQPATAAASQTFTLDSPGELMERFAKLFDECDDIGGSAPERDADARRRQASAHSAMKMAFLRSFKQGLPADIMLHRLEESSATSHLLLAQTRLLILISLLTLVAVATTLILTQVRFP